MKLFYNPSGTVKVLPVSVLPVNAVWNGGFPYTPEGSLLVSIVSAKPTDTVSNGGFIQELWGGVCAGYDTPSIWIGGLAITSYGALCLDVDGGIVTDGPALYNSLTHTAIPTRAATGTTATFTRATAKTWPNNDGYLVTGVAGEIGFVGARRVRNLISTSSEDIPNYSNNNSTVSASAVAISRVTAVYDIYETAATGIHTRNRMFPALAGHKYVCSVRAKAGTLRRVMIRDGAVTGAASTFDLVDGAVVANEAGGVGSIASTEDAGVYLLSMTFTAPADGNYSPYIYLMRDGTAGNGSASYAGNITKYLTVGGVQVEDVTAQTTQTAGEYVSVGVTSAPYYHGSFVDGVKCFPTDISGNPIPSTTLLGYQAQGARTNLCLQSQTFNNASWVETGTVSPTQNLVGPDGGTTGWTLTDNDAGTPEGILQTYGALTAANYAQSIFIRKTSGATSFPVIRLNEPVSPSEALCTIDTNNGVATVWTAYTGSTMVTSSASCVSHNADWWRVTLVFAATTASWRVIFYPAATTNATQATGTVSAAVTGTCGIYGSQLELGSFATSYIATTTIAVARNADVLTYSSAGNIDGTKGWCYAEFDVANDSDGNQNIILGSDVAGVFPLYAQPSLGNVRTLDGTNAPIAQSAPMTGIRKGAGTWGGSTLQCAHNGVVSTTTAFDGNMNVTSVVRVGEDNAGNSHLFGTIRNVRIGQRQLSASELQAITS